MLERKIPRWFLHRALMETRAIRRKIESLESDISRLEGSDEEDADDYEFSLPGQDLKLPSPQIGNVEKGRYGFNDPDYLASVVRDHHLYAEKYIKEYDVLVQYVPMPYLMMYDDLLRRFEELVHERDPDFPLLDPQ